MDGQVARLGFGGMFGHGKTVDRVDLDELSRAVDVFLDSGYNFFDNAFAYDAEEPALERVLFSRRAREDYEVSQKITPWKMNSPAQMRENFERSLASTSVDYYDYLMLHNVSTQGARAQKFEEMGAWDFVLEQKERGLAAKVGFSFHDRPEMFESFIEAHPQAEFVMLQLNYYDWNSQLVCAKKNYEVAHTHGLPIFVMKPFRGGVLARLPEAARALLDEAGVSPAELALGFCASVPGVHTVFATMNSPSEVADDIAALAHFPKLSPQLRAELVDEVVKILDAVERIECVDCRYCVDVCPKRIRIPWILQALNDREVFGSALAQRSYLWETNFGGRASECISCGRCLDQCSTRLDIPALLARAAETFEGDMDNSPSW